MKNTLLLIIIIPILNFGQVVDQIPVNTERNRTTIPVYVNGLELKILLDTGMSFDGLLLYNPDLDGLIKLNNTINVLIPGAGSGPPSEAIMDTAGNFSIGEKKFQDQKILLLTSKNFSGFPTDGVVGYSIFGHYATEINYDTGYMTLHNYNSFSVDSSWEKIPLYFKDNTIPWIDVKIKIKNEEPILISTYIDFAAGETIELLERANQKFTLPDELTDVHLGTGLSGDIYGTQGRISELNIGSYSLTNIFAAFTTASIRSKQLEADGIIGNGSLKYFNLIFDYKNKSLYIKPNNNYLSLFAE
jgi:hypothetical protein